MCVGVGGVRVTRPYLSEQAQVDAAGFVFTAGVSLIICEAALQPVIMLAGCRAGADAQLPFFARLPNWR